MGLVVRQKLRIISKGSRYTLFKTRESNGLYVLIIKESGDQELLSLFHLEIRDKLLACRIPYALTVLTCDLRAWAQSATRTCVT